MLKIIVTAFILLSLITVDGNQLFAADDNSSLINNCISIEDFEAQLECIKTRFNEVKTNKQRQTIFSILIERWHKRDGAEGPILSDIFLDILMRNPDFFFKQMVQNKALFEEWLEKLEPFSFVWHSDSPSPLKLKKENLIKILQKFSSKDSETSVMKQKLLNRIQSITPR